MVKGINLDYANEILLEIALFHACEHLSSMTDSDTDNWRYRIKQEAVQTFEAITAREVERLIGEKLV